MASPASLKSSALRAAAILTTGVVSSTTFVVPKCWASRFTLDIRFTVGSLTNVTLLYYVSMDASTWVPCETLGAGVLTHVLTADTTKAVNFDGTGWAYFKVTAQGSGTVTSSSLTLTSRFATRGV